MVIYILLVMDTRFILPYSIMLLLWTKVPYNSYDWISSGLAMDDPLGSKERERIVRKA